MNVKQFLFPFIGVIIMCFAYKKAQAQDPDTTPPKVATTNPSSGTTVTVDYKTFSIKYNEPLYIINGQTPPTAVSNDNIAGLITITKGANGSFTNYTLNYDADLNRIDVIINSDILLDEKSSYYIKIGKVKDATGNTNDGYTYDFKTGAYVTSNKATTENICVGGAPKTLDPIIIKENTAANFKKQANMINHDIKLQLPSGFRFIDNKESCAVAIAAVDATGNPATPDIGNAPNISKDNKTKFEFVENEGVLNQVRIRLFTEKSDNITGNAIDQVTISGLRVEAYGAGLSQNSTYKIFRVNDDDPLNDAYLPGLNKGDVVAYLKVVPKPSVSLNIDNSKTTFCQGENVVFYATPGFTTYEFYVGNTKASGADYTISGNRMETSALAVGDSQIKVKAGNHGCLGESAAVTVTIEDSSPPTVSYTDYSNYSGTYEDGGVYSIGNDAEVVYLTTEQGWELGPSNFIQKVEGQEDLYQFNPEGKLGNFSIYYRNQSNSNNCKPDISFTINVFNNVRDQIVGLKSGGFCYNTESNIPIGWFGQKKEGSLQDIYSQPYDVVDGEVKKSYDRGIFSGLVINMNKVRSNYKPNEQIRFFIRYLSLESNSIEVVEQLVPASVAPDLEIVLQGNLPLKSHYCQNDPSIKLQGNPLGTADVIKQFKITNLNSNNPTAVNLNDLELYFAPKEGIDPQNYLTPNNGKGYEINYEYINEYGCTNSIKKVIYVEPLPERLSTEPIVFGFCIGDKIPPLEVPFEDEDTYQLVWYDQRNFFIQDKENLYQPEINTTFPSTTRFFVTQRSKQYGCEGPSTEIIVNVGEIPVADFDFSHVCSGEDVSFTDKSKGGTLPYDTVATWQWNFGDPDAGEANESADQHPTHSFSKPGTYTVSLTASSGNGCSHTVTKKVNVFSLIPITNGDIGYMENFEGEAHGWIHSGITEESTKSSWNLDTPQGNTIKGAASGNRAWITNGGTTEKGESTNTYNVKERSWVESPCFDFSGIENPMVAFKFWSDTERGLDGAVLQYKIAGSSDWKVLGNLEEGINWYNMGNIISSPGGQSLTDGNLGWSYKDTTGWKDARFMLDEVKTEANGAPIRFRIAFSSNESNFPGTSFDGFAFDDFRIRSRKRKLVLEHFMEMDKQGDLHVKEDDALNAFATKVGKEGVVLRYVISHPNTIYDTDYQFNIGQLRGKAFYYGVNQMPRTVLNGKFNPWYKNEPFFTNKTNWGKKLFYEQALQEPKFLLKLNMSNDDYLHFNVEVRKLPTLDTLKSVLVHIFLVEEQVEIEGKTYYDIVREAAPDLGGTYIKGPFYPNEELVWNLDIAWTPPVYIRDKDLKVVAYVQDFAEFNETKEIYQSTVVKLDKTLMEGLLVSGIREEFASEEVKLVPNPASDSYSIRFASPIVKGVEYKVYDQLGKVVEQGKAGKGTTELKFSAHTYTSGMYLVHIRQGQKLISKRLLIN